MTEEFAGEVLFKAVDVAKILGIKNISDTLRNYTPQEKVLIPKPPYQAINYLTKKGFCRLLQQSRSPHAIALSKQFGLQQNYRINSKETIFAHQVISVFQGEEITLQKGVGPYRIDLYFEKHKLAVEFDERYHERQQEEDKEREQYIKSQLAFNFLTELGLYRLILASKKPFAKQFKKWVCSVIKEIRLTGQYQLQKEVDESKAKLIEFQEEKAAIKAQAEEDRKRAEEAEAARKEAEAKAAEEQKRHEELELKLQKRTYEPIEKTGHVYVIETDGGIKTANRNDIKILLDFETSNPDLLERTVHYILDRYRSNSNREFFDCDTEHIKRIVILAGNTIDTLKSMYENISADEFITRVNENVGISMCQNSESVQVPDPYDKDKLADFLETHCELGEGFQVDQDAFVEAYAQIQAGGRRLGQAESVKIKTEMAKCFRTHNHRNDFISLKDGARVRGWRGLKLKTAREA
ncbi:hypothetical protein HK102_009735, partial [Quaeritorhiza haematococci]